MSKKTQQVRAWKFLMEQVKNIQDPLLKRAMIADFRERALRDWGWDPANGTLAVDSEPKLQGWEKEFVEDIHDSLTFGFNVAEEKQAAEFAKARVNMMGYIRDGGTLAGIPDDIRTPDIEELYYECLHSLTQDVLQQADNVMPKRIDPPIDEPELIGDILPRVMDELSARARIKNEQQ